MGRVPAATVVVVVFVAPSTAVTLPLSTVATLVLFVTGIAAAATGRVPAATVVVVVVGPSIAVPRHRRRTPHLSPRPSRRPRTEVRTHHLTHAVTIPGLWGAGRLGQRPAAGPPVVWFARAVRST